MNENRTASGASLTGGERAGYDASAGASTDPKAGGEGG